MTNIRFLNWIFGLSRKNPLVGTEELYIRDGDFNKKTDVQSIVDLVEVRDTGLVIDDVPVDGQTTKAISSNWAYDHENAADPHPNYLLESAVGDIVSSDISDFDAAGTASGLISTHENAADPHPNYALESETLLLAKASQLDSRIFGFLPVSGVTLSFNEGTNTFTLTPDSSTWPYYRNGVKNVITGAKSVVLPGSPPTAGQYYIYIDSDDGTLIQSQTPWSLSPISTVVLVALLEYNNSLTPKYVLYTELHPMDITRGEHLYLHSTFGTRYGSGGALVGTTLKGSTDVGNVFGISSAVIYDETLKSTIPTLNKPDGNTAVYLVRYLSGSTWVWSLSAVPYLYSGTYIYYNSAGSLSTGGAGNYYTSYLLLTPSGFQILLGQNSYNSLSLAKIEVFSDLNTANLPIVEFVAVKKFTWRTGSGYSQKGKCRLEQIDSILISSIPAATGSLSASQIPVTHVPVNYEVVTSSVEEHLVGLDKVSYPSFVLQVSFTNPAGLSTPVGQRHLVIPRACKLVNVTVLGSGTASGSTQVSITTCSFANYPTASSITNASPPTISSAAKVSDSTLSGWTVDFVENDILITDLNSVSGFNAVTVIYTFTNV